MSFRPVQLLFALATVWPCAGATAAEAKSTADAAMSCCNENKDRIERMFEQTMKK